MASLGDSNLNFTIPSKAKNLSIVLMIIGVLGIAYGFLTDHDTHGTRQWANLLVNTYFFFGISVIGLFYIALAYAAEAAWSTVLKRIFEAVSTFLPIGGVLLLIIFLAGTFHLHHIYHWMDPELYNEFMPDGTPNPKYDMIIANKEAYLNTPFFYIRSLLYIGVWVFFQRLFRKRSLEEDLVGGLSFHRKNITSAAIFLVFFGFTSSTSAWDWIMSIDTHWFSTLFGWYIFSGMWVSSVIFMILLIMYLKNQGYLSFVNESHIHDMGKWMFAISFLWSYLWFSQFMLIWYANIPEEVTYYLSRFENYKFLFFFTFAINFILPMIILMSRQVKRTPFALIFVGIVIFIGHWLDTFLCVMPGTVNEKWHLGFAEIGTFLGFLGLFIFVVLTSLTKAPLLVKNHPFLDESLHQHT